MHRIKREWCAAVSIKLNQVSKRTEGIANLTLDSFHRLCFLNTWCLTFFRRPTVSSVRGVGGLVVMVGGWQGHYLMLTDQHIQSQFDQEWAEMYCDTC